MRSSPLACKLSGDDLSFMGCLLIPLIMAMSLMTLDRPARVPSRGASMRRSIRSSTSLSSAACLACSSSNSKYFPAHLRLLGRLRRQHGRSRWYDRVALLGRAGATRSAGGRRTTRLGRLQVRAEGDTGIRGCGHVEGHRLAPRVSTVSPEFAITSSSCPRVALPLSATRLG